MLNVAMLNIGTMKPRTNGAFKYQLMRRIDILEIRKNNVISTNPFVYWRRVSRTTLYAFSSHFIVYNFFLLQVISSILTVKSINKLME